MSWYKIAAINQDMVAKFEELARSQRGAPEDAMLKIQYSQISQLYGWVAEHMGDLTHRMAQNPLFFKGGYPYVREKVDKVLTPLTQAYGFEKEVLEQIERNRNYRIKNGELSPSVTEDKLLSELKDLGKQYSAAHSVLKVYNDAQRKARDAAVAYGNWNFGEAIRNLSELKAVLDQGPKAWEGYALEGISA